MHATVPKEKRPGIHKPRRWTKNCCRYLSARLSVDSVRRPRLYTARSASGCGYSGGICSEGQSFAPLECSPGGIMVLLLAQSAFPDLRYMFPLSVQAELNIYGR
jgi:hypothetical protein